MFLNNLNMNDVSSFDMPCETDTRAEIFIVVSIVMFLSFLSNSSTLPLWWWKENQRELRLRLCFTNIVCGVSYFLMYCGIGVIVVHTDSSVRQRFVLRNIDWLLSVGNIIWLLRVIAFQSMLRYMTWEHIQKQKNEIPERWFHLISATGYILKYIHPSSLTNPNDSAIEQLRSHTSIQATCWNIDWSIAIILGTIAEVITSPFIKVFLFIVAVGFFIPLFMGLLLLIGNGVLPSTEYPFVDKRDTYSFDDFFSCLFVDIFNIVYRIFYACYDCQSMDEEEEAKSVVILRNSLLFVLFTWICYPVAWIFAEAEFISKNTEVIVFGCLDVITKSLFAYFICNVGCTHFERVEKIKVERDQKIAQMRSEFFLQMNHELRTPLNAVIALSQLMLSGENLSANQETCSQSILSSAESLLSTINDVLDFSRMESKGIIFDIKPFNLIKSLEDTVDIVAVRAHENNIEISTDLSSLSNIQVNGDRFRLHQIVLNIANNAVKFSKEGGSVTIRAELVSLDEEKLTVAIYFIDNGVGIPKSQLPTLFEPFSPATEVTVRVYGGSGLGLSICKKLIEMMGGKIEVESEVGVGTTIRAELSFPIVPGTLVKESVDAKILVLNNKMQQSFSQCKKLWNCEVQVASIEKVPEMQGFDFLMVEASDVQKLKEKITQEEIFAKFPQVVVMPKLKSNNPIYFDAKYNPKVKYLTIPIKRTALYSVLVNKTAQVTPKLVYHNFANCKLLLVEDNKVNQKVMSMLFKKLGMKYEVASDGLEGYEAALTGEYDIILMDIQMPVLDGIGSTKKIRESENCGIIAKKNVIIALTAGFTPENEELCLKSGMNDFMSKPVDIGKLQDVIGKYVK